MEEHPISTQGSQTEQQQHNSALDSPTELHPNSTVFSQTEQHPNSALDSETQQSLNSPLDATILSWAQVALSVQQRFHDIFKNRIWEKVDSTQESLDCLERNIGYSLFGPPPNLPGEDSASRNGYDAKQTKKIKKIHSVIVKLVMDAPKVIIFLFVIAKINSQHVSIPILRVVQGDSADIERDKFVDDRGRVYKGWFDFLQRNTLPNCLICCPKEGFYSETEGKVNVEFTSSSSSGISRKILNILNLTTMVAVTSISAAALLVTVPGVIVTTATVGGAVSGCYGLHRCLESLVDRKNHGQTLSLKSSEARNTWLATVGGTAGLFLGGLSSLGGVFAKKVDVLRALSTLIIGNSAIKGLVVMNDIATIVNKIKNQDQITPLDAFQLSSSILFFGGSVISMDTAFNTLRSLVPLEMPKVVGVMNTVEQAKVVVVAVAEQSSASLTEERDKVFKEVDKGKMLDSPEDVPRNIAVLQLVPLDDDHIMTGTSSSEEPAKEHFVKRGVFNTTILTKTLKLPSVGGRNKCELNSGPSIQSEDSKVAEPLEVNLETGDILIDKTLLDIISTKVDGAPIKNQVIQFFEFDNHPENYRDSGASFEERTSTLKKTSKAIKSWLSVSSAGSARGTYTLRNGSSGGNQNPPGQGLVERNAGKPGTIKEVNLTDLLCLVKTQQLEQELDFQDQVKKRSEERAFFGKWLNVNRIRQCFNKSGKSSEDSVERECSSSDCTSLLDSAERECPSSDCTSLLDSAERECYSSDCTSILDKANRKKVSIDSPMVKRDYIDDQVIADSINFKY